LGKFPTQFSNHLDSVTEVLGRNRQLIAGRYAI
jgi:hypothetical protein